MNARKLVSDEQLIAFLKAVGLRHGVRDAEYAVSRIGRGEKLDEIFYTGDEYGYYLSARKLSHATLKIVFGCLDDPFSDAGSEWRVAFDGSEVAAIFQEVSWVC